MGKLLRTFCLIFAAFAGLMAPSIALAKTSLDVSVGYGGAYRGGRWTPVFITAADDSPRNVEIEVYTPHDLIHGMRIRQTVAITPSPATFAIYAPMPSNAQSVAVTIRDAGSKRRLAYWDAEIATSMGLLRLETVRRLIGVTGTGRAERMLEQQLSGQQTYALGIRTIPTMQLPTSPLGLDSLDAMILDEPDLARIAPEQQAAIISWVRGGGRLLCWPGSDSIPAGSEIITNLPARVEENISYTISEAAIRNAGLPPRFRELKARRLIAAPGAETIQLFSGELPAYRRTLGFGSITLLPMSPSTFTFTDPKASLAFWQTILGKLVPTLDEKNRPNYSQYSAAEQNEAQAAAVLMDQLGSVPGAGSFGFSYVVIVMIGMMLIVGPVDWIVLKKLNRQPWTWATTTGWIAMVTLGAIYLGHIYKSGDLHFRTVQLIDQADSMSQAVIDTAGIYSPRTQDYFLKVDPEGWWEPFSASVYYRGASRKLNNLGFHQDRHGTRADAMQVNVWNLEFIKGETIDPTSPMLSADLHVEKRGEVDHVVGTITNLTDSKLSGVKVRVGRHAGNASDIGPAESLKVDVAMNRVTVESSYAVEQGTQIFSPQTSASNNRVDRDKIMMLEPVWGIASRRGERITELLVDNESLACIYATSESVAPRLKIESPDAIPMHRRYIRAMVSLSKGQP